MREPGNLPFGVVSGMLLHQSNGFFQSDLSLEIIEELAVSDALHRVTGPVRQKGFHFCDQSVRNHLIYPLVDPPVEFFPGSSTSIFSTRKGRSARPLPKKDE